MKLTTQTGDVPADVLVELLQRLIGSTGRVPPIPVVEACVMLDTVLADLGDTGSKERRAELFRLGDAVRSRVLALNR
jgi:hypothetical protein